MGLSGQPLSLVRPDAAGFDVGEDFGERVFDDRDAEAGDSLELAAVPIRITELVLPARSRSWYRKLAADSAGGEFDDLAVTRNGRAAAVGWIFPDRVFAALAHEAASMPGEMFQQIAALHAGASCGSSTTCVATWSSK